MADNEQQQGPNPRTTAGPDGADGAANTSMFSEGSDAGSLASGTTSTGPFDADLGKVPNTTMSTADAMASKPDEITEGLMIAGITTWEDFICAEPDVLDELKKKATNHKLVDTSRSGRSDITFLHGLVWKSHDEGHNDWDDPHRCTKNRHTQFRRDETSKQRRNVAQRLGASAGNGPKFGSSGGQTGRHVTSMHEKEYDSWGRRRSVKESFQILKDDSAHEKWKRGFTAELKAQKLQRITDPSFDPAAVTDSFDELLCTAQNDCFWTVLLRVFANPLGNVCLTDNETARDARKACSQHEKLQKETHTRMLSASMLLQELLDLQLSAHSGNRIAFLSAWFDKLQALNDASKQPHTHSFIESTLLNALKSDDRLADEFMSFTPTGNGQQDVINLKSDLVRAATPHDGKDDATTTSGRNGRSGIRSAHATQWGGTLPCDPHDFEHIVAASTPEATGDAHECAINRARMSRSEARIRQDMCEDFDPKERAIWRDMPEEMRIKIAQGCSKPSTKMPAEQPPRQVCKTSSDTDTKPPVITANDQGTVISEVTKQLTVQASRQSDPSKRGNRPLRSELGDSHPSVLLSNDKKQLFDKDQRPVGCINTNFHSWLSYDDHDDADTETPTCSITKRDLRRAEKALVDRGANGFVGGSDCVLIGTPLDGRKAHITGVDHHQTRDAPIATVGALAHTNEGPAICVFNEVACTGRHQSILSALQMEDCGVTVDDRHPLIGGTCRLTSPDGFTFPLSFHDGLPHLDLQPCTTTQFDALPHVMMTSDQPWNPRKCGDDFGDNDPDQHLPHPRHHLPSPEHDLRGECIGSKAIRDLEEFTNGELFEDARQDPLDLPTSSPPTPAFWIPDALCRHGERIARCMRLTHPTVTRSAARTPDTRQVNAPRETGLGQHDFHASKRFFAWAPTKMISQTFRNSTQMGHLPASPDGNLFKRWHAPNPALNVFRLNDDLLTDEISTHAPAIDAGHTDAQIFFGRKSHIIHVEPITEKRSLLNALQSFVRRWGAPNRFPGDHASNHTAAKMLSHLELLWIGNWRSEPCHQHQSMFERRYQTFKRTVNRLMDRTGTPPKLWHLCMCCVACVFNRVSDPSLDHRQPIFVATGSVADISPLLQFSWLEPVHFKVPESSFPSDSTEALGHWVGVAEHVGHSMTCRVWNPATDEIVDRSILRPALLPGLHNARAGDVPPNACYDWLRAQLSPTAPPSSRCRSSQDHGEMVPGRPPDTIFSTRDDEDTLNSPTCGEPSHLSDAPAHETTPKQTPDAPKDAILLGPDGHPKRGHDGRFITMKGMSDEQLKGTSFLRRHDDGTRERMTVIRRREDRMKGHPSCDDFIVAHDKNQAEDIMTHNDIMNFMHQDELADDGTMWKFERTLSHEQPSRKSDPQCVEVEWENGETTAEPLRNMKEDDPATLAKCALDNDLLETPGWRGLKRCAEREKKLARMINQVRLRSFRTAPKCECGFRVPKDWEEAKEIDLANGNDEWHEARDLEITQLDDCRCFIDMGIHDKHRMPKGCKKITAHSVFDVKHDGRHEARMVAGGHLTDTPLDGAHAGAVSLRGLRMCVFLAELNRLEAHATDMGNACSEATTGEKACIKAGPEFMERSGHPLITHKASCGLKSSGKEFGELLSDCSRESGFTPSKAEPETFCRRSGNVCEHTAAHVDDLCFVMKQPEEFLSTPQREPHDFKLKGSGPLAFHLGCGFRRDEDNSLMMDPTKHIEKMMAAHKQLCNAVPSTRCSSAAPKDCHPELDTSEFLEDEGMQQFQSPIGSLQWLTSTGRWDVMTAVMSLSSCRAQPRKGHLETAKHVHGCVCKTRHCHLEFRTDAPDTSTFDNAGKTDWSKTVCDCNDEDLPDDAPEPLGNIVFLVHCFDANLMHDVLSGKAVAGCLHLANETPIMWCSKKQATVETATCGAEFVAARTCIEQVTDSRNTFRHPGVELHPVSHVFGDNESVINGAAQPHSRLRKRHNISSLHCVRSQSAKGCVTLKHTRSQNDAADMLSKHWGHNSVKTLIKPFFCAIGNAAKLHHDDTTGCLDDVFMPLNDDGETG